MTQIPDQSVLQISPVEKESLTDPILMQTGSTLKVGARISTKLFTTKY